MFRPSPMRADRVRHSETVHSIKFSERSQTIELPRLKTGFEGRRRFEEDVGKHESGGCRRRREHGGSEGCPRQRHP